MDLRAELATWPVGAAEAAVVNGSGILASTGGTTAYPWASVTKILTALVLLDAVEEGVLDLDEPAGPPGSTLRHLLGHTSGVAFDSGEVLAAPGRRRIYSNRGYEMAAALLEERTGVPFADRLHERLLEPVEMTGTRLEGSPAADCSGPVDDLARLAVQLLEPVVLSPWVVTTATTTAFPGLSGVLPGFGRQDPNDWALGCEVRDHKSPHWTAETNSPATAGHFGQSGSFLWVDPEAGLGCVSIGDTAFDRWAAECWPPFSAKVLTAFTP